MTEILKIKLSDPEPLSVNIEKQSIPPKTEPLTVVPLETEQVFTPDGDTTGYNPVRVSAIEVENLNITDNGEYSASEGKYIKNVTVDVHERNYGIENALIGYNYPIDTYYNDSLTNLRGDALVGVPITNIILNNLTTLYGGSNFYNCSAQKIIIPKCTGGSINTTFGYCRNLQLLDCSLSAIGAVNSFIQTPSLTTIIIRRNSVATLSTTDATRIPTLANGTCNIYVPDDLVDDYKNATNWLNFPDQIKPISELEEN